MSPTKKNPKVRLDELFMIRLTAEDRARVEALAERLGEKPMTTGRRLLLWATGQVERGGPALLFEEPAANAKRKE
jgi:hypothetical protein